MEEEKKGCVYFFKHTGLEPIKIGYSTNESPLDRFYQFKTYAPYGAEIIGFIRATKAKELETKLHYKYSNKRLEGEWFDITIEEVKKEIKLHEDIQESLLKSEFQLAWAKECVQEKLPLLDSFYNTLNHLPNDEVALAMVKKFPNETKKKIAEVMEVSRQMVYNYLK